eukprot:CAMPEP_0204114476 /NCGR_PEP_ID=MMETSP0361-20130328/4285_1 /ASSEMBLY_ACC=CAM_ASM_000343 /TAXON_ID=268821 /ORGANISM="Scrippsiella Hangoei, Strain SHTV-5" /LENGTH=38 /DNA_ID= /DNA_START= /DNA_END= /DNA_ORIENTATION=
MRRRMNGRATLQLATCSNSMRPGSDSPMPATPSTSVYM